ncbi:MAG: FAD-binding oxidoreductase [Anaerolineales bacterium]|nr:FAD-binding oxidoreductase [Anaerolineales bacterium]MCS7247661.1 FAD-binding oxidoreductase [Anaerolineales bacterium]MDW8161471.1 FAD-binding oxidoreductase [Anaerolineales bacterium]MDW8446896.1 FAD-binding oxidoreductase [Anaerolineales bacterium]
MQSLPDSPLSLWLDTYGEYHPQPPLEGEIEADIAIIGGGFTGLMTAYELKRVEPTLRIVVLEAKTVGYGASGRNGSFAMTVVGLGFGVMPTLMGVERFKAAHRYMMRAVEELDALIEREKIECERIRPGFLRVATTKAYVRRLQEDVERMNRFGFSDIFWLDQAEVRQRVNSPRFLGALWEPRLVLVNPAKLVRAERDLALRYGAEIYENTPAVEIRRERRFRILTPRGKVYSEKLVFATNAYTHLFPLLRRKQIPAFTYMVATEPLSERHLESIGWQGREGIEDARNLIHYYRLTPDRRLVIGGGPVGITFADDLNADRNESAWRHLEEHIRFLFPNLRDVRVTHRWGGPFSVTIDLTPAMGYLGDRRAVYSVGCIGHGVSASHLNAQTLRDLLLERRSELTECPFVRRRVIPWPPEPLRSLIAFALRGYLQLEDWWYERELRVAQPEPTGAASRF